MSSMEEIIEEIEVAIDEFKHTPQQLHSYYDTYFHCREFREILRKHLLLVLPDLGGVYATH